MGIFEKLFKPTEKKQIKNNYDLDLLSSIQSIQIPNYKPLSGSLSTPVNNIEYILQSKATEHAGKGGWNEAIACLKK